MPVTASTLRADIYNLLDQALETGVALEVERKGKVLRIVPPPASSWLDRLPVREGVVVGDPADLVDSDGLSTWSGELL